MSYYQDKYRLFVMKLDLRDRKILSTLQSDASISQNDLADHIGMSRTACWRRVKELRQAGIIKKSATLLDPEEIGLHLQVLLSITMTEHGEETKNNFENHVKQLPEVMQCFSISGDRDYLLHIVAKDMKDYDAFLNRYILPHPTVRSASSTFALRQVKYKTEFPLEK